MPPKKSAKNRKAKTPAAKKATLRSDEQTALDLIPAIRFEDATKEHQEWWTAEAKQLEDLSFQKAVDSLGGMVDQIMKSKGSLESVSEQLFGNYATNDPDTLPKSFFNLPEDEADADSTQ